MRSAAVFLHPGLAAFTLGWLLVVALAFDEPLALARANAPLVAVGFVGAVIANATSIGGALLFIPYFVLAKGLSALDALKLSLATQAFGLTSGALAWLQRGGVPTRALPTAALGSLAGGVAVSLTVAAGGRGVQAAFGPVAIAIGLWMLYLRKSPGHADDVPPGARGILPVALLGGGIAALTALGVGELVAALLIARYRVRAERAIGLGVVLAATTSIGLTLVHQLALGGIPWSLAAFVILGAVFGARLGPSIATRLPRRTLQALFAALAIATGALMVVRALL